MTRWLKIVITVLVALAILAGLADWCLHSRYFERRMAAFVAAQIARASGLHATFGAFHPALYPLGVNLNGVVIHGRESATEPALATIPHVYVRLHLASVHPLIFHLTALNLDRPQIHVYRMSDGAWNLPRPPVVVHPPAEPVFDFGVERLRLSQGELDFQDRRIPLNAALDGVHAQLQWTAQRNYAGLFAFDRGQVQGLPPALAEQQGRLQFTLWPNDIRIDQLTWRAGTSRLAAHGMLHDLDHPALDAVFQTELDLASWRRTAQLPLLSGQLNVQGQAHWSPASWSAAGRFTAADLRLQGRLASTGVLTATGPFAAGPHGLRLPDTDLRGVGGIARAQFDLAEWKQAQAHLQVHGLQLERLLLIAAKIAGQPRRIPPLAGTVEAQLAAQVNLTAPAGWSASGSVAMTAPATRAPRGQPNQAEPGAALPASGPLPLPLSGSLQFTAQRDRWSVAVRQLRIQTPNLTLLASGAASPSDIQLQVAIASDTLTTWQPYLAAYLPALPLGPGAPPPGLAGHFRAQATISGTPARPTVVTAVTLTGFHYGPLAADQLNALATITPSAARLTSLTWRLQGETFSAHGQIGLRAFRPTPVSALAFRVRGRDLAVGELQRWAGLHVPVSGQLSLAMAVTGTSAQPRAAGSVQLLKGRILGQPVPSLEAQLALSRQSVAAQHFEATVAGSRLSGAAQYDWRSGSYALKAAASGLELAQIAALQSPQMQLAGRVQVTVQSQGTLAHPRGTAELDATNLSGAGESLGSLHASFSADGAHANMAATVGLPGGRLTINGAVAESRPYPLTATARLEDYDIDALLRRFTQAQLTGHSRISGSITVQGPLTEPAEISAQATFDPLHLSLEDVSLSNSGPVQVTLTHRTLSLAQARLIGPDTDFSFAGHAQLARGGELDGTASGHINLALIHSLHPTTHAAGELSLTARLSGGWRQPALDGNLQVRGASLAEENLPVAFDHIEGGLRFTGTRVEIQHLSAETGGGDITLTGFAARTAAGFTVNLEASGSNLRIRYQGVSATCDLQLRLNGQQNNALLSGQAELTRVAIAPNFDFALFLASRRTSAPSPVANSLLDKIHLDVRLTTGPQVEVATGAARLQIQADLRARGTLANPVLLGRASVAEGEIRFAGNQYTISKGEVTFANPFHIQPVIDFGLSTTVQQYDITLNISGPVDKLDVTYRSDPPLSSSDIVALLATGQTQESSQAAISQESTSTFVGQSEQLLGLAFDNLVNSRLERMFGVTQIQVNPNATGLLGTGQATVTVQQQISRALKVTYTQNLATSSQDIIQVEWAINRHLGMTISRDQFGLYGISFHFRHRAR